jgi:hypothetical protein
MKIILILIVSLYQISFADNIATTNDNNQQPISKSATETTKPQNTNDFLDIGNVSLPRIKTENSVQLPKTDFEPAKEDQSEPDVTKKQIDQTNSLNPQPASNTTATDNISTPVSPAAQEANTPTPNNQAETQKQETGTTTPQPITTPSPQTSEVLDPPITTPVSPAAQETNTPAPIAPASQEAKTHAPNNEAEAQKQETAATTPEPITTPSPEPSEIIVPPPPTPVAPAEQEANVPAHNNQAETQKQEAAITPEPITTPPPQPSEVVEPPASVSDADDADNAKPPVISQEVQTTPHDKSVAPENTKTSQKVELENTKKHNPAKNKPAKGEKQKHNAKHVLTYPDPEFFDSETTYLLSQQYEYFDNKVNYDEYLENLPYIDYIAKFWNEFMTKEDIKQAQNIQKYLNNYERFSSKKNILNP